MLKRLYWTLDLFELFLIGVLLYAFCIALGAYERAPAAPVKVHAHQVVRLAKLTTSE